MCVSILLIVLCLVTFYVITLFLLVFNFHKLLSVSKNYVSGILMRNAIRMYYYFRTHFINDMCDKYRKSERRLWKSSDLLLAQV